MNYLEARAYLKEVNQYGSVLGLKSIKELLKRLGNPQKDLKIVHVAGTNGKGSTMTFLQSILMEAGYSVGRYSSPAVFTYREIIRVNNKYIEKDDLAEIISILKEICDDMVRDGLAHPTPFEIETAMAFIYFKKKKCDITLVECGMGGETDATNVFDQVLCSVITSISLDHMKFLGNTINEIATVKAGIIKNNCPVVVSSQSAEAVGVIRKMVQQKNAHMIVTGNVDIIENEDTVAENVDIIRTEDFLTRIRYEASNHKTYGADLKMIGTYQGGNAATAIEASLVLETQGFNVEKQIVAGLENAFWPGRLEVICDNPLIVIDGAHNPGAVSELKKSIDLYFTNKKITFIMGVLADKDFSREAEMIADRGERIITITPDNARALDGRKLVETICKYNKNVQFADSLKAAVKLAEETVKNNQSDMILAFGSLSFLGDLKSIVNNK